MAEAMIEVEGLTKRFGTFTAVDHVSFSVGKGSIFGFLGPNGSGKTTVIRMLCGILEPTDGTARIGGHDIVRDLDPIKEMIGYMSQKFSLYDELTVNENLIFAGKLYGLSGGELDQRRDEMIATTHLEPYIDRRAAQLSGGWRQRLAMACSLMHRPSVLFLDEPTRVRSATSYGQSMHLLVDDTVKRAQIEEQLREVGVAHVEIHEIGPSLEDVFLELAAKHAAERQKAA